MKLIAETIFDGSPNRFAGILPLPAVVENGAFIVS